MLCRPTVCPVSSLCHPPRDLFCFSSSVLKSSIPSSSPWIQHDFASYFTENIEALIRKHLPLPTTTIYQLIYHSTFSVIPDELACSLSELDSIPSTTQGLSSCSNLPFQPASSDFSLPWIISNNLQAYYNISHFKKFLLDHILINPPLLNSIYSNTSQKRWWSLPQPDTIRLHFSRSAYSQSSGFLLTSLLNSSWPRRLLLLSETPCWLWGGALMVNLQLHWLFPPGHLPWAFLFLPGSKCWLFLGPLPFWDSF